MSRYKQEQLYLIQMKHSDSKITNNGIRAGSHVVHKTSASCLDSSSIKKGGTGQK